MPRKKISRRQEQKEYEKLVEKYTRELLPLVNGKTRADARRLKRVIKTLVNRHGKLPTQRQFEIEVKRALKIALKKNTVFQRAGEASVSIALDRSSSERGRGNIEIPDERKMNAQVRKEMIELAQEFQSHNTIGTQNTAIRAYRALTKEGIIDVAEMTRRMDKRFRGQQGAYNATAVQTGVRNAVAKARYETALADDYYTHKQWITRGDLLVRLSHMLQNRQIVKKDALFKNKQPYAGISYRCRCIIKFIRRERRRNRLVSLISNIAKNREKN